MSSAFSLAAHDLVAWVLAGFIVASLVKPAKSDDAAKPR
jgi:hypothetical protein